MAKPEYKNISVEVAKEIATTHNKDCIVIVGWDEKSNQTHMTTFGKTPEQKEKCAQLGDWLGEQMGLVCNKKDFDFRYQTQGQLQEQIDRLKEQLSLCKKQNKAAKE